MTKGSAAACVLAAFSLAACNRLADAKSGGERAGRLYQAAMADYAAGRIDAAIAGFEKVVKGEPGNASARFQLATLLPDSRKDVLAALCHYREYLILSPSSDKATVARERAEVCERQFASELLAKMRDGEGTVAEEMARLRSEAASSAAEVARLKAELEKAASAAASAQRESERVRKLMSSVGAGESAAKPVVPDAQALLDEEDDEDFDRVKFSADVGRLLAEEKEESTSSPFAAAPKEAKPAAPAPPPSPLHEERPETYVVQEGDTLYKIAIRFYGRRSAWTKIRDANKTVISMDGRVNAGQRIALPK